MLTDAVAMANLHANMVHMELEIRNYLTEKRKLMSEILRLTSNKSSDNNDFKQDTNDDVIEATELDLLVQSSKDELRLET